MIVGRNLGTADLAQYKYAYRIASLPSLAVIPDLWLRSLPGICPNLW